MEELDQLNSPRLFVNHFIAKYPTFTFSVNDYYLVIDPLFFDESKEEFKIWQLLNNMPNSITVIIPSYYKKNKNK